MGPKCPLKSARCFSSRVSTCGQNPSGKFEVWTWGSSTGSVASGAVVGLGLREAQSSRDMAATVPEKADICPRTMPFGIRFLVFPVCDTSIYHVWLAVQSMVPVATCERWRSYTWWRWVMTQFLLNNVCTGTYPRDRGGRNTSCARRTLACDSLAAPASLGGSALAYDTVLPRRRMGTLHPFSTWMYPLGPQMWGHGCQCSRSLGVGGPTCRALLHTWLGLSKCRLAP